MRILMTVDESEHALHAVRYVGSLLQQTPDIVVTLFHVLKPIPRGLLEHGGSENPHIEEVLSVRLREEREAWLKQEKEAECPILERACETLMRAGFDESRIVLKFGHEDDIAKTILEEARTGNHDTIVVSRTGTSGITRIFGGGVIDYLLRDAPSLAIWIITKP